MRSMQENNAFNGLIRRDKICNQCLFHTVQVKKPKGWQCQECGSFVEVFEKEEVENVKFNS